MYRKWNVANFAPWFILELSPPVYEVMRWVGKLYCFVNRPLEYRLDDGKNFTGHRVSCGEEACGKIVQVMSQQDIADCGD